MKKVALYVRVSTESQLENYSIDEQVSRLKAYCVAKDFNNYKIYTDGGFSGGNINRPALNKMLTDIKNNLINTVIVYKLDRLSRSQKDTLMLIEDTFLKNNVDFISLNENFDTSTPFGRAMIGILSVFAQLEKEQITERFAMGRVARSKAGLYHGGATAPTGYNYIDGKLVIDDYKALQVREVYDKFLSGYSIHSIREFMADKYGGWTSNTLVVNILKNSTYTGKVKFSGAEYEGVHTPIISQELFSKTQEYFIKRSETLTDFQKTPFKAGFLLSSIIYCGNCGAKYSAAHGYYKCYSRSKTAKSYVKDPNCKNANWLISELDTLIANEIKSVILNSEKLKDILNSSETNKIPNNQTVDANVKKIDAQISKLIDLYQMDNIPIDELNNRMANLQQEKEAFLSLSPAPDIDTKAKFMKTLKSYDNIMLKGNLAEKRLFISNLIKSIIINESEVTVNWRV